MRQTLPAGGTVMAPQPGMAAARSLISIELAGSRRCGQPQQRFGQPTALVQHVNVASLIQTVSVGNASAANGGSPAAAADASPPTFHASLLAAQTAAPQSVAGSESSGGGKRPAKTLADDNRPATVTQFTSDQVLLAQQVLPLQQQGWSLTPQANLQTALATTAVPDAKPASALAAATTAVAGGLSKIAGLASNLISNVVSDVASSQGHSMRVPDRQPVSLVADAAGSDPKATTVGGKPQRDAASGAPAPQGQGGDGLVPVTVTQPDVPLAVPIAVPNAAPDPAGPASNRPAAPGQQVALSSPPAGDPAQSAGEAGRRTPNAGDFKAAVAKAATPMTAEAPDGVRPVEGGGRSAADATAAPANPAGGHPQAQQGRPGTEAARTASPNTQTTDTLPTNAQLASTQKTDTPLDSAQATPLVSLPAPVNTSAAAVHSPANHIVTPGANPTIKPAAGGPVATSPSNPATTGTSAAQSGTSNFGQQGSQQTNSSQSGDQGQGGSSPHDGNAVQPAFGLAGPAPGVADHAAAATLLGAVPPPLAAAGPHAAPAASPALPVPAAAVPTPDVNSARLIQSVGQSEMRVGMHSPEFGNISIHTAATRDLLSAQISLDHDELAKTLLTHLPEMQAKLGNNQPVELRIDFNGQGSGQGQGTFGGSPQGSDQEAASGQRGSHAGAAFFRGEDATAPPLREAATNYSSLGSSRRLDITV